MPDDVNLNEPEADAALEGFLRLVAASLQPGTFPENEVTEVLHELPGVLRDPSSNEAPLPEALVVQIAWFFRFAGRTGAMFATDFAKRRGADDPMDAVRALEEVLRVEFGLE